jgi:hypothetical protein
MLVRIWQQITFKALQLKPQNKAKYKKTFWTSVHKELQHDFDSFSKLLEKKIMYSQGGFFCKIA